MSPLYVGVCKDIRFWQKSYKDYIGPCMKRLGSTPIIPACKHSGIKKHSQSNAKIVFQHLLRT